MSRIQAGVTRLRSHAFPTVEDLRRRAAARVTERIDLTRNRHKPLSLLRMEARRLIEQYLELEANNLSRSEREKLTEEILSDLIGIGPLEELFRDDAVKEIMVLAHNQVIVRKGENWIPTSVHFRDAEQYRSMLMKMALQGEPLGPADSGPPPVGEPPSIYVRLPNGFRMQAVVPPAIMEHAPLTCFVRGALPATDVVMTPTPRTLPPTMSGQRPSVIESPSVGKTRMSESLATKMPSGTVTSSTSRTQAASPPATEAPSNSRPAPGSEAMLSGRAHDPFERLRQRVIEKMISRMAAAGVYDINQLPKVELQRVLALYVEEITTAEKIYLDAATKSRLTLEILAAMNR